jgi:hypothetical protein
VAIAPFRIDKPLSTGMYGPKAGYRHGKAPPPPYKNSVIG